VHKELKVAFLTQRIPHNAYKTAIMRCPSVFENPETGDSRPQYHVTA